MRSWLIVACGTVLVVALWAAIVFIGALYGWWRPSFAPAGNIWAFMDAAVSEIDANYRGNLAFRLIKKGELFDEHFVSIGDPVDSETLFQVASLSKWGSRPGAAS